MALNRRSEVHPVASSTKTLALPLLGLLAAMTMGCSGNDEEAKPDGVVRLELLTFWPEENVGGGIQAVMDVHHQKHPNVELEMVKVATGDDLPGELAARRERNDLPALFHMNVGSDIQRQPGVLPVSAAAEAAGWADAFPAGVTDSVTGEGNLLGVPLALTRQNNVFYSKRVLDEEGLEVPTSVDEFKVWLDALVAAGYEHPLCIGDVYGWTLTNMMLDELIPSMWGADYHAALWRGEKSANDDQLRESVEFMLGLAPYLNPDFAEIDWDKGVARITEEDRPKDERCVMTAMGDWAGPYLMKTYGYQPDVDFIQAGFPGAQSLFVLSGDAICLPEGGPDREAALELLATFASVEGQLAFNSAQGSVPARGDVPVSELGALAQRNMEALRVSAVGGNGVIARPSPIFGELSAAIKQMMVDRDPAPVWAAFESHYTTLAE
ncbi:MAG TPA: ABC transporter substrate-binding protein [Polyangiaceae bacterium]|nr:ABC transporter substrate-binding protein [Polyangiaceae bacterium]